MSFFGNLLKIIAIGAFFIATGPFGLAVSNTLATALRIGGVVLSYLGALVDRPHLLQDRQSSQVGMSLDPGTAIPVVYGRAKIGAIVADWFLQPANNFKQLYMVAVFAHGSRDSLGIAGVDEIWFNQRRAIDTVTGARVYPYKGNTSNYKIFLGSTTQNVGATKFYTDGTGSGIVEPANVGGSGWSLTTDTGKGLVVVGFVFVNVDSATVADATITITSSSVANPTVITTVSAHGFATGDSVRIAGHSGSAPLLDADWVIIVTGTNTFTIPANVTVGGTGGTVKHFSEGPVFRGPPAVAAIVRGVRVFDSRTSVWTAGGDNPAMCVRDFLLAPIYGCGSMVTPAAIHEQSFKDMADYCDVMVSHPVGTAVAISNSDAATERVNTSTAHGWVTGTKVRIAGHTGATPVLNGDHVITVTSTTSFTLNDVANITVGGTGGTATKLVDQKRFTCNGVVDTGRYVGDTLQELLSSCRGNLVWEQGQFKLTIRSETVAAPMLTLDPSIIIGDWSFRNAGQEEKWNIVKASYLEPANGEFKTQEVQWPTAGASNAYLTADNDFTNRLDLALPFTNDQLMAQAIAQVTLNEARLGITAQCHCTEAALALSVGDKVNVTHPTPGWTLKPFWVTALQLMPETTVAVSLQEYDPTAYDLSTMEDRRTFPATTLDSIFVVPTPGAVTAAGLATAGLRVTWVAANYGLIDYYEIQAKCTSCGDDYATIGRVREGLMLQVYAPLARPGQTWDSRVRVVNVIGWPSEWVNANQVAIPVPSGVSPGVGAGTWTGYAPTVVASMNPPDITAVDRNPFGGDVCNDLDDWTHTVSWVTSFPNDTSYHTDVEVATDSGGTGYALLLSGLTTDDSSFNDHTGVAGNISGSTSPTTFYRKYKVKIIRNSDSAVIDSMETSQGTLTTYTDPCS